MARGRKSRSNKKRHNRKSRRSTMKKGGCGCGVIKGGNVNSPSFNGSLPLRYYYGQNDEINNPNTPGVVENSRNLPEISFIGGKKSRRRRQKKVKGGDMLYGSAYFNNPFMNFGTSDGAANSVNILYGNQVANPSVFDQPALRGFNNSNTPLA
jgi:hypothetical protein